MSMSCLFISAHKNAQIQLHHNSLFRNFWKVTWILRSFVRVAHVLHLMWASIFSFDISLWSCPSLSLTGLMRWQHRDHPLFYCFLFMLNLNVLSAPRHYLTPCPWAAAVSLFNSPRWQKVRDCSELLSHTASRETLLHHLLLYAFLSSVLLPRFSLHFLPLFIQIAADKVWLMKASSLPRMKISVHDLFFCFLLSR